MPIFTLLSSLLIWGLIPGMTIIGIIMWRVPRLRCTSPWLILIPMFGIAGGLLGMIPGFRLGFPALVSITGTISGCLLGFWFALPGKYE